MHTITVGSDVVEVAADHLLINARHPMVEWRIREFCRQPIYLQGQKFYLRNRRKAAPPFAIRYELAPWPEDLRDESPESFRYDEAFVAARDAEFRSERHRTALWYVLLPVYPLLGLCWSRFKENVLWPIGFVPVYITSASMTLVFCAVFLDAIFFGFLGGGLLMNILGPTALGGWAVVADLGLIGILALDCALRFSQLLNNQTPVPDGFLEWLWPKVS